MKLKFTALSAIFCLLLIVAGLGVAAEEGRDRQIRVYPDSKEALGALLRSHYDIVYVDTAFVEMLVYPAEHETVIKAGYKTEIVHESATAFYRSRLDTSKEMGGYKTLAEIYAYVDSMIADHPMILSARQPIGKTIENRDMYAVKLSDNHAVDEDEPEVLFSAAIHAREVITPEVLLNFMNYLTDNYGTDSLATYLVDNREIWLVLVVNPDGYYHNQVISPGGGGNWRKNRRNNGNGTFGVDLNRNYGYEWGYDDEGSSPDPSDDTYRGTGAFSEPETQVMRDFAIAHEFVVSIYFHSYSDLVLWPWGYDQLVTPDNDIFSALGTQMATWNGYDPGPIWSLYVANGGTDDWHYGEQTLKEPTFAFTIEVGDIGNGFWPDPDDIPELVGENLQPMLYLADQAERVYQLRAPNAPTVSVPAVVSGGSYSVSWSHVDTLNPGVAFELVEMQNPGEQTDAAVDFGGWSNVGFAVSTARNHSAPSSFFSGTGHNLDRHMTTSEVFQVDAGDTLRFWTWYDIEDNWDYAYVMVSTDGSIFSTIPGNITTNYDPNGTNLGNGITGASSGWVQGVFSLSAFTGQSILIRLAYITDGSQAEAGFFVDDIYPVFGYGSSTVLASDIAGASYSITDQASGYYYYKVRARDAEDQWSAFSNVAETFVQASNVGDLDLDGVAYSVADWELYEEYFDIGLGAFGDHLESSIAQSDADCDGMGLTGVDAQFIRLVLLGVNDPCVLAAPKTTPEFNSMVRAKDDPEYAVTLVGESLYGDEIGYVDIVQTEGAAPVLGFQFAVEYDHTQLNFLDAELGSATATWQRLDWREQAEETATTVQLTALIRTGLDSVSGERTNRAPGPLVRLQFRVLDEEEVGSYDVRFVWESCRDNTIAVGTSPDSLLQVLTLSHTVFDADLVNITGTDPRYGGCDEICSVGWPIPDSGGVTPRAAIEFTSGRLSYSPSCCRGTVGNIDNDAGELVTMGDLTVLIDALFISYAPVACEDEANVDLTPPVSMSDLTVLIDHLFISYDDLPPCP